MAEIIKMPKLSDTMTEGVVAAWHKKVGDQVASGELLAEIETDKATMEFESYQDGYLLHIGVGEGGNAPVDSLLCIIGTKGEDVSALLNQASAAPEAEAPKAASAPAPVAQSAAPAPVAAPVMQSAPVAAVHEVSSNGRLKASPLARKMAEDKGIAIESVAGSGENGRIVKRDVENFVPTKQFAAAAHGVEQFQDVTVSQMRKTIARRLAESKFTAPHFYLTLSIDMDNAIAARKAINTQEGVKVSFNDMVIKASALALKQHPAVNAAWMGDTIRYNKHVHIGVAVAVEDGLLVPVIRFADSKGLSSINDEVKVLADKAKSKKLQPQEWEGNTFTISNLGMFGIEEFTAIINPPDSCIMAVGAISEVPVVKNGQVVPGNVMKVTLSCDHRVVDGASGAAFLQTVRQYLENPVTMLT
ncbi:MAG: pyruvate dehydrogenase complex dihydrolipoamide acetyltransferase [Cryomorphaceae bacterium]|nr:pyruvate dehydrogenase complex dihydrolipoamide acetyltransferase [Cryomorphaceae bacterium]